MLVVKNKLNITDGYIHIPLTGGNNPDIQLKEADEVHIKTLYVPYEYVTFDKAYLRYARYMLKNKVDVDLDNWDFTKLAVKVYYKHSTVCQS